MSSASPCLDRNIFGDKINFRMMKHEDSVELIVERDGAAGAAIASSSAVFVAGFALSSLLTRQEMSGHLSVALVLILVCWSANAFLTVTSERIQIFHFAHGLQYSRHYRFGFRKVVFMHSQRVILNEVVSMQRVILFLSCLMGPADRLSGRNRSRFEIVPLLTHLHPRQELLKVIYNHLLEAFKKTDANIAPARNNHNHKNHLSSESRANKSLVKSHESSAPSSSLNPQTDTYHLFC